MAKLSSGKKMPKLHTDTAAACSHCRPRGRQRDTNAPTTTRTMPAGITRTAPSRRGRSSGSSSVMVTKVVPQEIGASTVAAAVHAPTVVVRFTPPSWTTPGRIGAVGASER